MQISVGDKAHLLQKNFIFGVSTAAFQIEGGADHRLASIWDSFCKKDGAIEDGSNGLIACDHYHHWLADIDLIQSLNVDAYRLSISWPRVIQKDGLINQVGLDFYKQLLGELKNRQIKAFVTFYHWDLPQHIQQQGGWENRKTAYFFQDYVDLISQELKGLVYSYATLNEPFCSAYLGYEIGMHAPGLSSVKAGRQAAHHLLLAHGLAMAILSKNSPETKNGIVLNFSPCYAASKKPEDIKAAKDADDYLYQWYAKPIFDGVYPDVIHDMPKADQPDIVDGDMDIIHHPIDYLGINYYTREVYCKADDNQRYQVKQMTDLPKTDMGWDVYPQGLHELLIRLNQSYDLPPIYITENGAAMVDHVENHQVNDHSRIEYFHTHLNAMCDAMQTGVKVEAYFAWSLMDNFEWSFGYKKRFGLVYVDYQTQKRTIKASGYAYAQFLKDLRQ